MWANFKPTLNPKDFRVNFWELVTMRDFRNHEPLCSCPVRPSRVRTVWSQYKCLVINSAYEFRLARHGRRLQQVVLTCFLLVGESCVASSQFIGSSVHCEWFYAPIVLSYASMLRAYSPNHTVLVDPIVCMISSVRSSQPILERWPRYDDLVKRLRNAKMFISISHTPAFVPSSFTHSTGIPTRLSFHHRPGAHLHSPISRSIYRWMKSDGEPGPAALFLVNCAANVATRPR